MICRDCMSLKLISPENSPTVFKLVKNECGLDITYLVPFLKNSDIKLIRKHGKVFVRRKYKDAYYDSLFENG